DATPVRRIQKMKKWKIAAATLAGGLTLSTGLAAAHVRPNGAQHAASQALSHMGIHVPDSDDSSTVTTTDDNGKDANEVENEHTSTSVDPPDNHRHAACAAERETS